MSAFPIKRKSKGRNKVDLCKSLNLLSAYGEYDRFIEMSKSVLKEKGIKQKKFKRSKKSKVKKSSGEEVVEENSPQMEEKHNGKSDDDYK